MLWLTIFEDNAVCRAQVLNFLKDSYSATDCIDFKLERGCQNWESKELQNQHGVE